MYFEDITKKEIDSFEKGNLSFDRQVNLFQKLVDSGMLWTMKNSYIATANSLVNEGHIVQRFK
jgi:hypothetical protein